MARASGADRNTWQTLDALVDELQRRSKSTLRERMARVRADALVTVQAGLAAGLSWLVANNVLHDPEPVFAPIVAVIVLGVSVGQRLKQAVELVIGVALGIAIGDGLVYLIGTGAWQVGLVVALATVIAVFLGGGAALVGQASTSAVLIATLTPPESGIFYTRFIDALVGGSIAVAVMALLLPANPLTVVSRTADPALGVLADGLGQTAAALRSGEASTARAALDHMSEAENEMNAFKEALPSGRELATIAPIRWRARGTLAQYVEAADYLTRALRNARVLTRRAVTVLDDQEPVPEELPQAVEALAQSVRELRRALARGVNPEQTSNKAVQAVEQAARAYKAGLGFSGSVVVAQIRTIATDLLGTVGLDHEEANRVIRRAGGNPPRR